jgi:hypothetical protein
MPQKLIRLTTPSVNESGKCEFTGLFNEEITIKENSEIALHSLSLERRSQELDLKKSNAAIKFASVNAGDSYPGPDPPGTSNQSSSLSPLDNYNKSNNLAFLDTVSNATNRVCSMLTTPEQMNIQYKCVVNGDGRAEIQAGVSPFYTIDQAYDPKIPGRSFPNFATPDAPLNANPEIAGAQIVKTGAADGATGLHRDSDTLVSPPNPAESYIYGEEPFIKSTGSFRLRFNRLLGNGGAVSAYMGLVKGDAGITKLRNGSLSEADMEYAFRIHGNNTAMEFKTFAAGSFSSTVTPINHTVAGADFNDILEIVIDNDKLIGQIHQNDAVGGTGTDIKTVLTSANVEEGINYYWFISFVEGKDNIVLDFCSVSLDPFSDVSTGGTSLTALEPANQALSILSTPLTTLVDFNRNVELTPVFQLAADVAKFLGWTDSTLDSTASPPKLRTQTVTITPKVTVEDLNQNQLYEISLGFTWLAPEPFDNNYNADNYLVDTQSFLLDSYDSYGLSLSERDALSGGSRRNILAVIPQSEDPISGTGNGIVQYQPNTLNFIRIRNRADITTRQLRFRLLTGRYQDVIIQNMAALTVLIRDPQGYEESK